MSCNVPVLFITAHGIWRENEYFYPPMNIKWGLSSRLGTINLLDPKVANSVPRIVNRGRSEFSNCDEFTSRVFDRTKLLDHTGVTTDRSRRPKESTNILWAKYYKKVGDLDGNAYLRQVNNGSYEVFDIHQGTRIPNKSYDIFKTEFEHVDREDGNDNRVQLLLPQQKPIDMIPNWLPAYTTKGPAETAHLRTADNIGTSLQTILAEVKRQHPTIEHLVIIDMACNSVDTADERTDRTFAREKLKELRTASNIGSPRVKSRSRSIARSSSRARSSSKSSPNRTSKNKKQFGGRRTKRRRTVHRTVHRKRRRTVRRKRRRSNL
jgi:hypothetical protein